MVVLGLATLARAATRKRDPVLEALLAALAVSLLVNDTPADVSRRRNRLRRRACAPASPAVCSRGNFRSLPADAEEGSSQVNAPEAESSAQIANPLVQASLLGEAVDGADIAVLVSDEDGRCIAVNQQACALLGYTRGDLLNLAVTDFVPDTDPGECFRSVFASGGQEGVAETLEATAAPSRFATGRRRRGWRRCASSSRSGSPTSHLPRRPRHGWYAAARCAARP